MATSSTTSFLSLPPEIRILIYESLLVAPRDGSLRAITHRARPTVNTRGVPPLCGTPKPCLYCTGAVEHYTCWSENLAHLQYHPDRTLMARTEREIIRDAISILVFVLNQWEPAILSGTICPSPNNSQAVNQGLIHEIFRRCHLMPHKDPLAVMSDAKRAVLACRTTRSKMAYEHEQVNATLKKSVSRQLK